jgi:hypothetical protein
MIVVVLSELAVVDHHLSNGNGMNDVDDAVVVDDDDDHGDDAADVTVRSSTIVFSNSSLNETIVCSFVVEICERVSDNC